MTINTGRGKLYLCSDEAVVVTKGHIEKMVGRLDSEGRFGADNRAGLPGQLHRISVMRSKQVDCRSRQAGSSGWTVCGGVGPPVD